MQVEDGTDQPLEDDASSDNEGTAQETEVPSTPEGTDPPPKSKPETVSEILEQAPEGIQLVVLDDEGQTEPLASQEAAEIVVNGDPIWCPAGVTTPQANTNCCTDSWGSFTELLDELENNTSTYSGDGIIYIAHNYASALDSYIEINGNQLPTLGSLTLQGGWDFTTQMLDASNPYSTLNNVSLGIVNWTGNLTINNLILNASDYGLEVSSTNDVTLSNVEVSNTTFNDGITVQADGNVTFSNVEASSNAHNGAAVTSGGTVSVTNSTFENNANEGAEINSGQATTVQNSSFSSNATGSGLIVGSLDSITLNGVTASNNGFSGVIIQNDGNVNITNGTFSGNGGSNYAADIEIASPGTVTLSSVVASGNSGDGFAIYDSPEIHLSNVTATDNGWDDVYTEGNCTNVYIVDGTYTGNGFGHLGGFGIDVDTGRILQTGNPSFNNNYSANLFVNPGSCYQTPGTGGGSNGAHYQGEDLNPVYSILGAQSYFLACKYETVTLVTQKDNRVIFVDVCDLDAMVSDVEQEEVSLSQLPTGVAFVNGVSIDLSYVGSPIEGLPSYSSMTISFVLPDDAENDNYSVYYYGNNLSISINNISKVDNRILVTGKFPGMYVLVKD